MAMYKFLPIPAEAYDALEITSNSLLEAHLTDDGELIIRKVTEEDIDEYICDGDCDHCPVSDVDCNGDCFMCPCYSCCDESEYERLDNVCNLRCRNV